MPFGCFVRHFFLHFPLSSLELFHQRKREYNQNIMEIGIVVYTHTHICTGICASTAAMCHCCLCMHQAGTGPIMQADPWSRSPKAERVAEYFFLACSVSFPLFWPGTAAMKIFLSGCNISFNFKNQEHFFVSNQTCLAFTWTQISLLKKI